MRLLRMKRLVLAGAVALSLAAGAVGIVALDEIDEALAQENEVELDGVVEAMPATGMIGIWQISGQTVQVTETTEIDQEMGALAVGTAVEVEGIPQADGSIVATELEVEDPD
jgi:ABC-type siderophore export system fused ATPase/permease subunit